MPADLSLSLPVDKAESAFHAYALAHRPAGLPWNFNLYQAQRGGERITPCAIFNAEAAAAMPGAAGVGGVCTVTLSVDVLGQKDDSTAEDHRQAAGLLLGCFLDKDAVRAALNAPADPQEDARVQRAFHVFDYFLADEGKRTDGTRWWSTFVLRVVCVGRDVAPA